MEVTNAQADIVQSTDAAEEAATVAIPPLFLPAEKADQGQHKEKHPPVQTEQGVADVYQTAAQAEPTTPNPKCSNLGNNTGILSKIGC